ncbi:hypothetical protein J6590_031125 [Homalodisca vitripennis]|nr:hypothetical protein J6590_031125 [Homalodisca vitripennis]
MPLHNSNDTSLESKAGLCDPLHRSGTILTHSRDARAFNWLRPNVKPTDHACHITCKRVYVVCNSCFNPYLPPPLYPRLQTVLAKG